MQPQDPASSRSRRADHRIPPSPVLPENFDRVNRSPLSSADSGGSASSSSALEAAAIEAAPVFLQAPQQKPTTASSSGVEDGSRRDNVRKLSDPDDDAAASSSVSDAQRRRESNIAEWRQHLLSRLHRRPSQEEELLQTYRNLSSRECDNPNGIILLSGPSGSGKTRLAKTLRKHVLESGGYFLSGKFDRLNLVSPAPYTALCSAFTEYTNLVLSRGPEVVQQVRSDIRDALGQDASVLTGMIPELGPLCGEVPRGDSASGATTASSAISTETTTVSAQSPKSNKAGDAMERFVFVFKAFLRAVASPDHPIVLSLDDIHYAVRHKAC
jgi:AAA ATPase domain